MDALKELLAKTIQAEEILIHEPTGLKIACFGDDPTPANCKHSRGHPPIEVLEHIYVGVCVYDNVTDLRVERFEDIQKLLEISMEGRGGPPMVVISPQLLEVMTGGINDK
jgi:hypothetical protein